jgi:cytochrome b6-f complex iron-sulfur subunit
VLAQQHRFDNKSEEKREMKDAMAKRDRQQQITRRNFLKSGVSALGMLALFEAGGASLLFMQPRSLEGEFLVHAPQGGFLAVYRRCTHLGCSVNWEPDKNQFFCPCHASSFDIHGDVENPPAPRALDTFPVQIADDQVIVDTSTIQSRDSFSVEQLAQVP